MISKEHVMQIDNLHSKVGPKITGSKALSHSS